MKDGSTKPSRSPTQVLEATAKKLHVFHRLLRSADGTVLATAEQMLLHVDTAAGRSVAADGSMLVAMQRLAATPCGPPPTGRYRAERRRSANLRGGFEAPY